MSILGSMNILSPYFVTFAIAISATGFMLRNSVEDGLRSFPWLLRSAIIVLLSILSLYIAVFSLHIVGEAYSYAWNAADLDRARLIAFPGGISSMGVSTGENGIIQFLLLTAYFGSVVMLLAILMVRIGLILLVIPLLPLFTALSGIAFFRKYARVLWEIFIEFSIFPFLALVSLYLSIIFSAIPPLQIALISLPALLPGYLFFSGRGPGSTPVMNLLGGLSIGAMAGSVAGYSRSAIEIGSGNIQDGMLRLAQVPSGNASSRAHISSAIKTSDPYRESVKEELKRRRYQD